MGLCEYTQNQKEYLNSGKLFDPVWALEGDCKCFLSEGTRACDIECSDCNNETYGEVIVGEITDAITLNISTTNTENYIIGNGVDPFLEL